jgi:PRC-barrel domain
MLRSVALAVVLSGVAVGTHAQSPPEHMVSTGDFNVNGNIAASALIGTKVRDADKQAIGKIDEVFLDKNAKVAAVAISVGGFLGFGAKEVAVKWSDLRFANEGYSLVVTTSLSKDALLALPDYDKTSRRKAELPDSVATAPPRPNPRQSQ